MTVPSFVCTNVLLYAPSEAPADSAQRPRARELFGRPRLGVSAQVLPEFFSAAVTKQPVPMTADQAVVAPGALNAFQVWPVTRELVLEAISTKQRFQISSWDAAILTAAKQMGCSTVYSEDLNAGQDYDGVKVVNPFAGITAM